MAAEASTSSSVSVSDECGEDISFSFPRELFSKDEDDHHVHVNDQTFALSDAQYAEDLQFQEIIEASLISFQNPNNTTPPLAIQNTPSPSSPSPTAIDKGKAIPESSHRVCEICVEQKQSDEMFRVERCSHSFCSDCITKHVTVKIQDHVHTVTCPGLDCEGVLELDTCKALIPKEVSDRWDEALTESLILDSQKFYCPFKDCSAMLLNDTVEVIRESECPVCWRLFCAQCRSPWHSGLECEEFQNLNADERGREDLMVRELAKEKNWMRCPKCKFYVERNQGCLHMTCRCKFEFCYACGATWTSTHGGCQRPS